MRARRWTSIALALAALLVPDAGAQEAPELQFFDFSVDARIVPTEAAAHVTLRVGSGASLVHSLELVIDPERHFAFEGDGTITRSDEPATPPEGTNPKASGETTEAAETVEAEEVPAAATSPTVKGESAEVRVRWVPPRAGGELRYTFRIDVLRDDRSYDARCAKTWAIFRGDDLVPPIRTKVEDGARSRTRLGFRLPRRWAASVPYPKEGSRWIVEHPHRILDRPTGWMAFGKLDVERETVSRVDVTIAGPRTHDVRALDMLALLRWTLPKLRDVLQRLPANLLIISADDPMWRGGLSGPGSLFLHADRPLITPDGSSPVLHELLHVATGLVGEKGGDWIVEGFADLYSIELLRRSSTIDEKRFAKSLAHMKERGARVKRLHVAHATGEVTSRAVTVLHALGKEIEAATKGERSLDDLLRSLVVRGQRVSTPLLREVAEQLAGVSLIAFFRRAIPDFVEPPTPKPTPRPTKVPPTAVESPPTSKGTPTPKAATPEAKKAGSSG